MTRTPPFKHYTKWSEAKFFSFIRSALRKASTRWPPKNEAKIKARRKYKGDNPRQKWEYRCSVCHEWFADKEVEVHHKTEVGSLTCYADIPGFVERLFCGVDGFAVICKEDHLKETHKN